MLRAIERLYTLASTGAEIKRSYALTWVVCARRQQLRDFLKDGPKIPIMNGIADIGKVRYLNEAKVISISQRMHGG